MAKEREGEPKKTLDVKISSFIFAKKRWFYIGAIALVVVVLVLWISLSLSAKSKATNQFKIDQLQGQYDSFISGDETVDSTNLEQSLLALSKKGSKYPAVKALYLLGMMSYENEDYQTARTYFIESSQKGKGTYMASLALFNAGVASEQLGEDTLALEYYQSVYDQYGESSAEAPKALFGVARIYEKEGNRELAQAVFQQLADEFPASEYAKLAQVRLVTL